MFTKFQLVSVKRICIKEVAVSPRLTCVGKLDMYQTLSNISPSLIQTCKLDSGKKCIIISEHK